MGERRNRVLRAFRFEETDFVPYKVGMFQEVHDSLVAYYGSAEPLDMIENHEFKVKVQYPKRPAGNGTYRDCWGSLFREGDNHTVDRLLEPALRNPTLAGYRFPEVTDAHIPEVPEVDSFRTVYVTGILEACFALRGVEEILSDIMLHRPFVEELLERLVQISLQEVDLVAGMPIDAVGVADDLAYQNSLFISLHDIRKLLKPIYGRIFERIKSHDKMVHVHCDGRVHDLIPDWIDIGMDIYNPVQPECNDIAWIKREFGKHLRFLGGVGSQGTLVFGTPDEVRSEVNDRIKVLGKGGGYILSHCKALRPETPVENVIAFIDAVVNQTVHP